MKDTRDKIIIKAIEYFAENDYERASLNDIASALNITKGGIYHYFESKDQLFKESVNFILDKVEQMMKQLANPDIGIYEMLTGMFQVGNMVTFFSEMAGTSALSSYDRFVYLMFASLKKFPEMGAKIGMIYKRSINDIAALFKKAQEKGEIRTDLNPDILAFELTALIEGSMLLDSIEPGFNLKGISASLFDNYWKRLKS